MIRSYSELITIETFNDRFEYLKLGGGVGRATFGADRRYNQRFYASSEWKDIRREVTVRDNGCDLAVDGFPAIDVLIHHMNPISLDDLVYDPEITLNPEYLITTTHRTHNGIHYGVDLGVPEVTLERSPGDTTLW